MYWTLCVDALDALSGNNKTNFSASLRLRLSLFSGDIRLRGLFKYRFIIRAVWKPICRPRGNSAGWIRHIRPWRFTMKANGNRDFPCMLSLSELYSVQGDHYHRKPEFDYVFFGPTFVPEVSSAPSVEPEDDQTSFPTGRAAFSQVGCGLLQKPNRSGSGSLHAKRQRRTKTPTV